MRASGIAVFALLAVVVAGGAALPPAVPPGGAGALAAPVDEVHREAEGLFEQMGGYGMLGKIVDMSRGQFSALLAQGGKTADDGARIFDEVLMPEFKARLPELRLVLIEMWVDNFTVEELRGLRAFYDTPLGRKIVEKEPTLAQQSVTVGAAWGQRVAQEALARHADELRKRGVKL